MNKIKHVDVEYNIYAEKMKTDGYQPLKRTEFTALWKAYSIDRKKGRVRGHQSIRERIEYRTMHKVSASVARRRVKNLRELYDVNITVDAAKDMDKDAWNNVLQSIGANPSSLYNKLKQQMNPRDAARIVSQVLYGSE